MNRIESDPGVPLETGLVRDYAHRMSQPLTAIMGYAEMLTKRLPAGTNEKRFAERILAESERLAGILAELHGRARGVLPDRENVP